MTLLELTSCSGNGDVHSFFCKGCLKRFCDLDESPQGEGGEKALKSDGTSLKGKVLPREV